MLKVYLDQFVVSGLCTAPDLRWQQTKIGTVLADALAGKACEVWVSPAHVLETPGDSS
jgi:hypothetical protein